uniref:Uncharacterized protein n=1 Tax=Romanomermis culicivorax TaxID=13658 RepID=A0A915KWX4_ROMCU
MKFSDFSGPKLLTTGALPTTPVVPSPISSSCDLDNSTNNLAIIVAPSLVTVTSPSPLTIILSKPLGPRDVRKVVATVLAAKMGACKRVTVCRPLFLQFLSV